MWCIYSYKTYLRSAGYGTAHISCGLREMTDSPAVMECLWWGVYRFLSRMIEQVHGMLNGMNLTSSRSSEDVSSHCRFVLLVTVLIMTILIFSSLILPTRCISVFLSVNYSFLYSNGYLEWRNELVVNIKVHFSIFRCFMLSINCCGNRLP